MSSNQLKCVKVTYEIDDVFKIPKHINLEDKRQVKSWAVNWSILHICLTNGKELKIKSEGWIESPDFRYPSNDPEIVDAEEVGVEDDDVEVYEEDEDDQ